MTIVAGRCPRPKTSAPRTDPADPADPAAPIVAWTLLATGLVVLAACVLLPEWRAHQTLKSALINQQQRLSTLRQAVRRQRRAIETVQSDPSAFLRMARRRIDYRPIGEHTVPVATARPRETVAAVVSPAVVPLPAPLARAAAWLPDLNYDAVFCDDAVRRVVIAMSLALIGVALWLPGRSPQRLEPPAS